MNRFLIAAGLIVALATPILLRADQFYPLEAQSAKFRTARTNTPMAGALASPLATPSDDPFPAEDREEIPPPAELPSEKAVPGEKPVEMPAETWVDRSLASLTMGHGEPDDPRRFGSWGKPQHGTSWLNRPYYVGFFAGALSGDELQAGLIEQGGGFIAGGRLGIDFDHYWGTEARLAFSDLAVDYDGFLHTGQSNVSMFDVNLLYYPLGDTRWRPYLSIGFGVHNFAYETAFDQKVRASPVALPIGVGLKYAITSNLAMRFDLTDNITFGDGDQADAMQNLSFVGGLELHFGGRRTLYSW